MIDIKITVQDDPVLLGLIRELDNELLDRYEMTQLEYGAYNHLSSDAIAVVMYVESNPVGCGAIRPTKDAGIAELKRMFVLPEHRGKRYGQQIVSALERIAYTIDVRFIRLETGVRQPEAVQLYKNCGYYRIPPYGPYVEMAESICMEKQLPPNPS